MKRVPFGFALMILAVAMFAGCNNEEVTNPDGNNGTQKAPYEITFVTGTGSLLADGLSATMLTATVSDSTGDVVTPGTAVTFASTVGSIEAITPTDSAGVATARLRSERFRTGLARVVAGVGSVRQALDVRFVSEAANHIELIELDNPRIGVRGTASPQTAAFTFEVRDRNAIPVDASHAATVSFAVVPTLGATDAALASSSSVTNDQGRVMAVLRSGAESGTVEVTASVGGTIMSQPIRVAIHGDLPDPDHLSIAFEKLNIAGLVYYGLRDAVTARVADDHGNPVPDSTVVWFNCEYGIVQGSAFTTDHGEATVDHVTAGPAPAIPGGDGLVTITSQTVSKAGEYITASGRVMWSGPTILEITSPEPGFAVPNGGAVTIFFRVHDANDNPLVGGTTIAAQTTTGLLGGDNDVTLPDTQSPLYTFFAVTVSDNNTADTDPVQSATVTIGVKSQNGNARASLTGTID